ncbi:DUF4129 domain-containing protein [Candidatus Bipolaricaulota bacterium]|nr:DUF4129 domain-containing protein [Candidatus Bipolaricaulota bacterium]
MRNWRVGLYGGLLILILVFLTCALRSTEFHSGRPLPSPGTGQIPGSLPLLNPGEGEWVIDLLRLILFVGLCLSVLALLFSKNFRRHALYLLITTLLLIFAWQLLSRLTSTPQLTPPEAGPGPAGPTAEGPDTSREIPGPPNWAVPLAAFLVGLGLALFLGPRLASSLARSRKRRAVQTVAREAVQELARGLPVSDVVLRAWLRMVEILSARSGFRDQPHLTPREFAENMAKLGFSHEAIIVLTRLFEEVRYGGKESETRRDEALAALAALEKAYA